MAQKVFRSDYLKLALILGLAYYIAFIPHRNYPYIIHIDEWMHLAYSRTMMNAGNLTFTDPFSSGASVPYSPHLEAGFHLFWGVFQSISGISWMSLFRFFPGIIFMIIILCAYVLGKRGGYGWEAAFFTCLIPTTLGILGPGFLVPVALGLIFVLLALLLVLHVKTFSAYLTLFIFICFLLATHAPEAVGIVLILTPYFLLNIRRNWHETAGMVCSLLLPFFIVFPWITSMLWPTFLSLFEKQTLPTYISWPQVIESYGILPTIICAIGIFFLIQRIEKKGYALVFGFAALLIMLMVYMQLHYGVPIMYDRGLMYSMLLISILAGYGLWTIRNLDFKNLPILQRKNQSKMFSFITHNAGNILAIVLIVITMAVALPARHHELYYHIIDSTDYEAFIWINDNIDDSYNKAILDPWKATAFSALTGKTVYSRIHSYPVESDLTAYEFLDNKCTDTTFLKENDITLVYTTGECNNPALVEVRENIYLLKK